MKYHLDKLKNGIKVLSVPMPSLESVTVTVWIKTGSRNETEDIAGISHFLEHMVFKGGRKRKKGDYESDYIFEIAQHIRRQIELLYLQLGGSIRQIGDRRY